MAELMKPNLFQTKNPLRKCACCKHSSFSEGVHCEFYHCELNLDDIYDCACANHSLYLIHSAIDCKRSLFLERRFEIRELPQNHPARNYGFTHDAYVLINEYFSGNNKFCSSYVEALEWCWNMYDEFCGDGQ